MSRIASHALDALLLAPLTPAPAVGGMTYRVDPVGGDDANPPGEPWKTYGRLNAVKLAPGDTVLITPGVQEETLNPSGEGTQGHHLA